MAKPAAADAAFYQARGRRAKPPRLCGALMVKEGMS